MGMRILSGGSDNDVERIVERIVEYQNIEPKPNLFDIKRLISINGYTIAVVNYPNCTTYNGDKICVYQWTEDDIVNSKLLDPHFIEGDGIYPIARFPSTKEGMEHAISFVKSLKETK